MVTGSIASLYCFCRASCGDGRIFRLFNVNAELALHIMKAPGYGPKKMPQLEFYNGARGVDFECSDFSRSGAGGNNNCQSARCTNETCSRATLAV